MSSPVKESQWLTAFRQCQHVAGGKDDELITKEIWVILKMLKTDPLPNELKQNLGNLLVYLICNTDFAWISRNLSDYEEAKSTPLFKLFMEAPPDSALIALASTCDEHSAGSRQVLCIHYLESFFENGRFVALLMSESQAIIASTQSPYTLTMSGKLLAILNSLPDKVANNTKGKFSTIFHHEEFFQLLSLKTIETFEKLVTKVRDNKDISVRFIAQMVGQFCFCGKGDAFLKGSLPFLIGKMKYDFVWRSLISKILLALPDRCLEATLMFVVNNIPWYGCMKWLFQDTILHNRKMKFILLHKFILIKNFKETTILRNVIGYIADVSETSHLVLETLKKLLAVWADTSAIKHVPYEQHKYVTQAILICIGNLSEQQCKQNGQELITCLMPGMSSHLDCPDASIRRLGMIVGEALSAKVDLKQKSRLDFQYVKDEETKSLTQLLTPRPEPGDEYFQSLSDNFDLYKTSVLDRMTQNRHRSKRNVIETFTTSKSSYLKAISDNGPKENSNSSAEGPELHSKQDLHNEEQEADSDDDDDDLQPYDLSNDTVETKVKRPVYIRDCMEGLLQTEDRERMDVCLSSVKYLINTDPSAAREVSLELCKILLVLEDTFALEDFTSQRHAAMTALTVADPEKVSGYLTAEFYKENYSLQHRLDMLDVLTAAAGVLSSVQREKSILEVAGTSLPEEAPSEVVKSWREIVDKRIESKTRRFGKEKKKPPDLPKANQFGPVAGCFFYPLLAGYDRRIRTLDLLGTDSLVLGRLLYSAGTIVYSAINTMAVIAMARSLLEFVLELRYHSEAFVRQAALFCVSMATISAGNSLVDSDVTFEINDWVQDVISKDASTRTKELATQTAMIISASFSKEYKYDK